MAAARRSIGTTDDNVCLKLRLPFLRKRKIANARKQFYLLLYWDRPILFALDVEPADGCAFERTDCSEARRDNVFRFREAKQRIRDFIAGLQNDGEDLLAIALIQ